MNQSIEIGQLAKALITFHVKIDKIKKDATNPFFKSKYATLSNILDQTQDALTECGLNVCQFPSGEHGLTTILMHESGEWISESFSMRPTKDDPQGRGSCLTYMRRYAMAGILSLNIDDDDDGNAASQPTTNISQYENSEKKWLNTGTPEFEKALAYMETGGSINAIKTKYKIRKEVEQLLTSNIQ